MERNFFIRPQQSAKLHLKKRVTIAFFPVFPHLPFRRLGKEEKLPLGYRVNVLAPVKHHHSANQSSLRITIKNPRKLNNFVFAAGHTHYVLSSPHIYSPRIFPSWTPTPLTAYLVNRPHSPSLAHIDHKLPSLWINILCLSKPGCIIMSYPPWFLPCQLITRRTKFHQYFLDARHCMNRIYTSFLKNLRDSHDDYQKITQALWCDREQSKIHIFYRSTWNSVPLPTRVWNKFLKPGGLQARGSYLNQCPREANSSRHSPLMKSHRKTYFDQNFDLIQIHSAHLIGPKLSTVWEVGLIKVVTQEEIKWLLESKPQRLLSQIPLCHIYLSFLY